MGMRTGITGAAVAVLAMTILYGCGPGFPIMTGEQAALVENVERLVKENAEIKKRLLAIEGGAGDGGLDDMRRSMAETTAEIEEVRRELSFVQGAIEESDHDNERIKEFISASDESARALKERLAAMDEALAANAKRLAELSASIEAMKAAPARPAAEETAGPAAETPEDVYARGYKLTMDKDYPAALKTFRRFLAENKKHKLAGNAQYWIGEIYYARGSWERAILEFNGVIKDYPKSEKVPGALLKQGFAFANLGSKKEARVLLREVVEKYPGSREAGLAKKRLKDLN